MGSEKGRAAKATRVVDAMVFRWRGKKKVRRMSVFLKRSSVSFRNARQNLKRLL